MAWRGGRAQGMGGTGADLTRRGLLRRGAVAAAGAVAAGALAGCGGLQTLAPHGAAPAATSGPVPLTVWFPVAYRDTPPFFRLLRQALRAAAAAGGVQVAFTYRAGLAAAEAPRWFPRPGFGLGSPAASATAPSPLANPAPVQLVDDPSLPMPDLVIAPHHDIAGYLAARALDLSPLLRTQAQALRAVPRALLAEGRAYAPGQSGRPQVTLPLLRVPLVCAVPKEVTVIDAGQPWTVGDFTALLQAAVPRFPAPNGPLAYVPLAGASPPFGPDPVPGGLVGASAVGHGTVLAESTSSSTRARFTTTQAQAAIALVAGWVAYAATYPSCSDNQLPPRTFTFFMGPLGEALGLHAPVPRIPPHARAALQALRLPRLPLPTAVPGVPWKLAPLPAFPARQAVPVDNLDVMVARDSPQAEVAGRVAMGLLAEAAQTALMGWGRGLSVLPPLALRQLASATGAAEATAIASPDADVALDDAYGLETDANAASYELVRQNLAEALRSVTGTSGGFVAPDSCSAPASGLNAARGPWLLAITEAQVACDGGTAFSAVYGGG
jgi:hypothetical protein